jgi:hypothetical protein
MNELDLVHQSTQFVPADGIPSLESGLTSVGTFCVICGISFTPKPNIKNPKTCGNEHCKYELLKKRMRKLTSIRTAKKHEQFLLEKPCAFCVQNFKPINLHKQMIYCSHKCKLLARYKRRNKPARSSVCVICGTEFTAIRNSPIAKCCSAKCRHKHGRNISKTRNTESANQIKLANRMRARILKAIRTQQAAKSETTLQLLGCSVEQLMRHLESLWTEGMSWENHSYHGWHIDHIKPCAMFDLKDPEQQKACFNFKNLQPMWGKENQKKSDRLSFIQPVA